MKCLVKRRKGQDKPPEPPTVADPYGVRLRSNEVKIAQVVEVLVAKHIQVLKWRRMGGRGAGARFSHTRAHKNLWLQHKRVTIKAFSAVGFKRGGD